MVHLLWIGVCLISLAIGVTCGLAAIPISAAIAIGSLTEGLDGCGVFCGNLLPVVFPFSCGVALDLISQFCERTERKAASVQCSDRPVRMNRRHTCAGLADDEPPRGE